MYHINLIVMQHTNRNLSRLGIACLAIVCTILFSFTEDVGGDTFEISLGDKVLIEQFVHRDKSVKTISLSDASANETLNVRYSHCGQVGNARALSLKAEDDKVLKTWNFPDAGKGTFPPMTCKVKEIISLSKGQKVSLVYVSREIPEGKTLATIVTTEVKASLNR
jgi:hypothetical protein